MATSPIGRSRILVLLVVTALVLLTFDQRGNSVISGARAGVGEVVGPAQGFLRWVTSPVANAWKGITEADDLERENARLRDQLEAAEGAAAAAEAAIYENNELRAENGLPTLQGIDRVAAEVVSGSPSNFDFTITINQGRDRGIKVGMPVVNAAGVVGRVTKVTRRQSVVRLINDPQMAVSVRFLVRDCDEVRGTTTTAAPGPAETLPLPPGVTTTVGVTTPAPETLPGAAPGATAPPSVAEEIPTTSAAPDTTATPTTPPAATTPTTTPSVVGRELGTLVGQGRNRDLVVENVRAEDCIAIGDPVLTSGIRESLFPSGIPVGEVTRATQRTGSLELDVRVEPYADLDRLYFVTVLLYDGDAAFAEG